MRAGWFAAVALFAACTKAADRVPDARLLADTLSSPDAWTCASDFCNVLGQTGCCSVFKCSWIIDSLAPRIGHIDCSPDGSVPLGGVCSVRAGGDDNCVRGSVCYEGTCRQICDQNDINPRCSAGYACIVHDDLFGPTGQPKAAGTCDRSCDPLANCDGSLVKH
ncbi:MAG: hypothetical protein JWO36_67 [Myxococcales bacterium]|nr:hypothetical protein [Myxococcales bacterium]